METRCSIKRIYTKAGVIVALLFLITPMVTFAFASERPNDEFFYRIIRFSTFYIESENYEKLLHALNGLDEMAYPPETLKNILYYKAECHFRMGHFFSAKELYLSLRQMIGDTKDPLYSEIEGRLSNIESKKRPIYLKLFKKRVNQIVRDPQDRLLKIFLASIGVALLTLFFRRWIRFYSSEKGFRKSFLASFPKGIKLIAANKGYIEFHRSDGDKVPEIIPEQELITLPEMMQQDGRIPKETVEEYHRSGDGSIKNHYFMLVAKAHSVIQRLNSYLPYPLALISKTPWFRENRWFWQCTIFGFLFIGIWTVISSIEMTLIEIRNAEESIPFIKTWGSVLFDDGDRHLLLRRFLLATVFIADLYGLQLMARRTIDSLDELTTLIENPSSLDRLESWIRNLFRSPWQIYIAILIVALSLSFKFPPKNDLWMDVLWSDIVFSIILIVLGSPLIWFLVQGVIVTGNISKMDDLETNPLSPMKTLGLQKWIGVMGTYAVVGSIVLTFGALLPIISAFLRNAPYTTSRLIWLFMFMPLLLVVWIAPYVKLRALIKRIKARRLHFLKNQISHSFSDWIEAEQLLREEAAERQQRYEKDRKLSPTPAELRKQRVKELQQLLADQTEMRKMIEPQIDQVNTFYNFFKEIDRSPENFFDFHAVIQLTKIMGIPSIFTLLTYLFNF